MTADAAIRIDCITLCRVCTLYPQDAINWIRADHNKTFQKLHLNIDTLSVLTNRHTKLYTEDGMTHTDGQGSGEPSRDATTW